jgi:hypothetical protein
MSTVSELVQANFKLTAELKQVRNELATLKAIKQHEDSEEVLRIKSAYMELEEEVVSLRKAALVKTPASRSDIFPTESTLDETSGVIAMLSDQLEREREKFLELEQRYLESTKPSVVYSESAASTSVGSPFYRAPLSIVCLEPKVQVSPPLEDFFKPPLPLRRTVAVVAPSSNIQNPTPLLKQGNDQGSSGSSSSADGAVKRLSKIARFRL